MSQTFLKTFEFAYDDLFLRHVTRLLWMSHGIHADPNRKSSMNMPTSIWLSETLLFLLMITSQISFVRIVRIKIRSAESRCVMWATWPYRICKLVSVCVWVYAQRERAHTGRIWVRINPCGRWPCVSQLNRSVLLLSVCVFMRGASHTRACDVQQTKMQV